MDIISRLVRRLDLNIAVYVYTYQVLKERAHLSALDGMVALRYKCCLSFLPLFLNLRRKLYAVRFLDSLSVRGWVAFVNVVFIMFFNGVLC